MKRMKLLFFSSFFFSSLLVWGQKDEELQRACLWWERELTPWNIFSLFFIIIYTYAYTYTNLFNLISCYPCRERKTNDLHITFKQIRTSFMSGELWKLPFYLHDSENCQTPKFNWADSKWLLYTLRCSKNICIPFTLTLKECIFFLREHLSQLPCI